MLSRKFICSGSGKTTYTHHVPAPLFRKNFELKEGETASVTITGLGFYELYINGRRITKSLLAPYISNPDHCVYYDTYDLSGFTKTGRNTLGVILGNGMQNCPGGQIWDFDLADFRGEVRFAFALEITDGKDTSVTEADETVKTHPSAITFDDLRCGCFYDARNEIKDWCSPDYDDSSWQNAVFAETPRGERKLNNTDPVLPLGEPMKPVSITRCKKAEYRPRRDVVKEAAEVYSKEVNGWLYDFGENTAGIETLKIKGRRGQQIDIQFAEFLNENDELEYSNINFFPEGYSQRDIYILSGEGEEKFTPMFTYHGARYALVLGLDDEQATEELLTFTKYASDIGSRGDFVCSDETANTLQKMARNSTLSNFYYFPTDCPHREKNGWTGDASVSSEQTSYNFAPEKSYAQWLENIRAAQRENGQLPGIIPTGGWGYHWGNGPVWDAVLFNLPYQTYIMRGDKKIIEDNAAAFVRYADYLTQKLDEKGLAHYGLGDWCPVTAVKAPLELTDTLSLMDSMEKASYMLSEIGRREQSDMCRRIYERLRQNGRRYLIDFGTMTAKGSCQTSQAAAIYYGLFEEGEKQAAFAQLLKFVHAADDHIDIGLIGTKVLFRVLADFGEADLAYKMITRRDYPSYGHFIEQGLTALPEEFIKDDEFPSSLNHHFLGDYSAWFIQYVAGLNINPHRDGCKTAGIKPHFIAALDFAEAHYDTVCGRLSVRWERTENGIELDINAPEGISGDILLPVGYTFAESRLSWKKLETGRFTVVKGFNGAEK